MSITFNFNWREPYGWYLISENDDDEDMADKTLINAGMMYGENESSPAYFFKDPLQAAAVLRLAGFEVLPWE